MTGSYEPRFGNPRDPNPGGSPDAWETSEPIRTVPGTAMMLAREEIERVQDERDAARRYANQHHLEACESCAVIESERDAAREEVAALVEWIRPLASPGGLRLCCATSGLHRDDCVLANHGATDAALLAELTALRRVRERLSELKDAVSGDGQRLWYWCCRAEYIVGAGDANRHHENCFVFGKDGLEALAAVPHD